MAGLSSAFKTKGALFRAALKANDLDAMRGLMKKSGVSYGLELIDKENCKTASADMIRMIVTEMDGEGWKRWSVSNVGDTTRARQFMTISLAQTALEAGRLDVLDEVLDAKPDFNLGKAEPYTGRYHLIGKLIEADMSDAGKEARLRKMLSGGYDKIERPEAFLRLAAERNFIPGVGLLAAAGMDVHASNELLLRNAAKNGQKELCLYLVETQKSDLELAVRTARELGSAEVSVFLQQLRPSAPEEEPPATVESLSAQMKEMKATLRELTSLVTALTAEKTLDKPPAVSVLKARTP